MKQKDIWRIIIGVSLMVTLMGCNTGQPEKKSQDTRSEKSDGSEKMRPALKEGKFDSFLFAQSVNTARDRRLIRVLSPDVIHRGIYEWTGTDFAENGWQVAVESLQKIKEDTGALLIGGVSGKYWDPLAEKGPATVDEETRRKSTIESMGFGSVRGLNLAEKAAVDHLLYKLFPQIDAGADGAELDEYGNDIDKKTALEALTRISNELKKYAKEKYNREFFLSANSALGGQEFPQTVKRTGKEPVDYYLGPMPFRIYGMEGFPHEATPTDIFDGSRNLIPEYRKLVQQVWPKRYVYFMDFGAPEGYGGPKAYDQFPGWYRIACAQGIAAGGFPGYMRTYYNGKQDSLDAGIFHLVANINKFMKENGELWHDLEFVTPEIEVSNSQIFTSAFGQSKQHREILHLVNGNFSKERLMTVPVENLQVTIQSDKRPSRVWTTTPDRVSTQRKRVLPYGYESGKVSFIVPEISVHTIVILEYDQKEYNPQYQPMQVVFPFPSRIDLPAGNTTHFTAVATEGIDGRLTWYVNGIEGGNAKVGFIDSRGNYTAPQAVSGNGYVVIRAQSMEESAAAAETKLRILPHIPLPWKASFTKETSWDMPVSGWEAVEGRGDWKVIRRGKELVYESANASDGYGNANRNESSLYPPFSVAGDQTWQDYSYSVTASKTGPAVYCYGNPAGTGIGIVFRYQDSKNYYQYFVDANNKVELLKVKDGIFTSLGGGQPALLPEDGLDIRYTVEVKGDCFNFYVNGDLVRMDKDSDIAAGAIGLKTSYMRCSFRDIEVKP